MITFEQSLLLIEDQIRKGFGINFSIKTIVDYNPEWLDQEAFDAMMSFAIALKIILEHGEGKLITVQLELF